MKNKKIKNHTTKPWLNGDGKLKSNEEMKKISKSWSADTWEAYLSSLETQQTECLLEDPTQIENLSNEAHEDFWALIDRDEQGKRDKSQLRSLIQTCLDVVSPREREILKKIFWENKSERAVADELGISRNSLKVLKSRGLSKIKHFILMGGIKEKAQPYGEPIVEHSLH